jgi:hypothetical protein
MSEFSTPPGEDLDYLEPLQRQRVTAVRIAKAQLSGGGFAHRTDVFDVITLAQFILTGSDNIRLEVPDNLEIPDTLKGESDDAR